MTVDSHAVRSVCWETTYISIKPKSLRSAIYSETRTIGSSRQARVPAVHPKKGSLTVGKAIALIKEQGQINPGFTHTLHESQDLKQDHAYARRYSLHALRLGVPRGQQKLFQPSTPIWNWRSAGPPPPRSSSEKRQAIAQRREGAWCCPPRTSSTYCDSYAVNPPATSASYQIQAMTPDQAA